MSTTIKLINNNITSYSYDFVCVFGETLKSPNKFQVHNIVLLIIATLLYIVSPEFIHPAAEPWYPLTNMFQFPSSPTSLDSTILLSTFMS